MINFPTLTPVSMRALRWQENGFVYEIVVASPKFYTLEEILAIAESMR